MYRPLGYWNECQVVLTFSFRVRGPLLFPSLPSLPPSLPPPFPLSLPPLLPLLLPLLLPPPLLLSLLLLLPSRLLLALPRPFCRPRPGTWGGLVGMEDEGLILICL